MKKMQQKSRNYWVFDFLTMDASAHCLRSCFLSTGVAYSFLFAHSSSRFSVRKGLVVFIGSITFCLNGKISHFYRFRITKLI